jgi:N-acetylmuramoyl-L-alanine amidase
MSRTLFVSSLIILLLFGVCGTAKGAIVKGLRYWSGEEYTRVVVDLGGPVRFTQNRLSNPERLYFDLDDSFLSKDVPQSIPIKDGLLKRVRTSQFDKDTVRVVLDLQEIKRFNVFILKDPYRLVIDVFGSKAVESILEERAKEIERVKRVVIDPGHGGSDPGAIGPRGLLEKDVVLDIAKRLGHILRKRYGIEVFFTRERDIYVPLEERTAIANSKNADLFISIHVNASRKRHTRGIETYFLNWTTNEESMRVAARENAISFKKMQRVQDDLQMILQDLQRDSKKDESMKLAGNIQSSMIEVLRQDYNDIVDLSVNYALFYVLIGAKMPSVLVEVSFISNYYEERRLSSRRYREMIAEGIAAGIDNYMESKRRIVKRASSDKI